MSLASIGRDNALARLGIAVLAACWLIASPATAQTVESFDPDEVYATVAASEAIDADLVDQAATQAAAQAAEAAQSQAAEPVRASNDRIPIYGPDSIPAEVPVSTSPVAARTLPDSNPLFEQEFASYQSEGSSAGAATTAPEWSDPVQPAADPDLIPPEVIEQETTYGEDDLIGAAEGVFGKGAEGLARLIEDLLKDQGRPNGYIIGREGGGAFIIGARYGSGTLHHKVEGERRVYWTGPSIGIDAGANAGSTFILVYNLYDTEELFEVYPAAEGQAYLVGGMHASYVRRGDKVLIPIRVGAGLRLGANAGYLRFSEKQRWLPF